MTALVTDDASSTTAKVTDLSEGHKYRFRVKAANAAGQSDPSEPTAEVCAKGKQRPVIDRRNSCLPVSVARGENIVMSAKFTGDPVPTRRWCYGKIEIKVQAVPKH